MEKVVRNICVVENLRHWKKRLPQIDFVSVDEYLFSKEYGDLKQLKIINLARNYGYLGQGYYVSLVAEARGHKTIPNISTMQALSKKEFYLIDTDDLNAQIQKDLANITDDKFELPVYFGRNVSKKYEKISRMFFNLFPCPFFRVYFEREKHKWSIASIKPLSMDRIPDSHFDVFVEALREYGIHHWGPRRTRDSLRYDVAILYNPLEKFAPSNDAAIQKFVRAGKNCGLSVEVIEKKEFAHLPQFDALFIRETTAIDHHTYRFAKKAEKEKMVVIDDPKSILYCTNKIFMNELFKREGVPRPKTFILSEDNGTAILEQFSFPIIIKIPDGSFSRGVVKVEDPSALEQVTKEYFKRSDYILAQEFMPTEFDWRIGIFNGKPLFACKYFMSRNHWQVINHHQEGKISEGAHQTFDVNEVEPFIINTALKAAKLIGDGLYGVDIKVVNGRPYVVEVNDNPNIDAGVEDDVLKDSLYGAIMGEFLRRIERLKMRKDTGSPDAAKAPSFPALASQVALDFKMPLKAEYASRTPALLVPARRAKKQV
jgi:glutathione synthase/RimK-type ligase-like ATP-grasp enzyme